MPKLQRFEGPNPSEVRARVLHEVGPEVEIVRAGRERTGGMLGFFEKELFVLEVAVPDEVTAPERFEATPQSAELHVLDDVAEQTSDVVTISSRGFAQTLSNVLEEAEATLSQGEGLGDETPARERGEALAVQPVPLESSEERPPASVASRRFRAWNRRGSTETRANLASLSTTAADGGRSDSEAGPSRTGEVELTLVPSREHALVTADERSDADLFLAELAHLGVPQSPHAAAVARRDVALLQAFISLELATPEPLPLRGDCALVVFGRCEESMRLARLLEDQLGFDDVVLPVSLRARPSRAAGVLSSPLVAAQAVAARRVEGKLSMLAVDVGLDEVGLELLARLIAGTRPEAVWAAVPAATSGECLEQTRSAIGALDALALYDLDSAEQPAALLASGIPIAYLDWHEATPLNWSARLSERLPKDLLR